MTLIVLSLGGELFGDEPQMRSVAGGETVAADLAREMRHAARRVEPGLVTIYALRGRRMTQPWRMREETKHRQSRASVDYASYESSRSPDDQGSGIVIDKKGFILTCHHVVASAFAHQ